MSALRRLVTATTATLLLSSALVGCDTEEAPATPTPDAGTPGPMYALATSTFSQAGSATYVGVFDSLDTQGFDLAKAREASGFATIGAVDGMLFVGGGEAPEVTRYQVGADGSLQENGKVSFANYGLSSAALYHNTFVSPTTSYLHLEETKRVVWNPSTMQIVGTADAPGLQRERNGLVVRAGFDRASVARDGHVFHAFSWSDGTYYDFLPSSQIAVYSAATGNLVKLLDAPCPGLDVATQDEAGNIYFSNWVFSAAKPAMENGANATCAVRIKAGELELDTAWTRSLNTLVGGRQTAAFRYLGNGVGLVAALDKESIPAGTEVKATTITGGSHWRLWRVSLTGGTAAPVEGLDLIAGGYYAFTLDGRTFLLLPSSDYAKTAVWELGVNGAALRRFETLGWAYQFVKVR